MTLDYNNYTVKIDASASSSPIVAATVKRKDTGEQLAQLRAIKAQNGEIELSLLTVIKNLKLAPSFYIEGANIEYKDTNIQVTVNSIDHDYTISLANSIDSIRLTHPETEFSRYYQASYYIVLSTSKIQNEVLYASINNSQKQAVETFKAISNNAYLTINYHTYINRLNVTENDVVTFSFSSLPFVEVLQKTSKYSEFPVDFFGRNELGFWECIPFWGGYQIASQFTKLSTELQSGVQNVFSETFDKVTVNSGNVDYLTKARIIQAIDWNDTYLKLDDSPITKWVLTTSDHSLFSSNDPDESVKLEFKSPQIRRKNV